MTKHRNRKSDAGVKDIKYADKKLLHFFGISSLVRHVLLRVGTNL